MIKMVLFLAIITAYLYNYHKESKYLFFFTDQRSIPLPIRSAFCLKLMMAMSGRVSPHALGQTTSSVPAQWKVTQQTQDVGPMLV